MAGSVRKVARDVLQRALGAAPTLPSAAPGSAIGLSINDMHAGYFAPALPIEVDVSPETMDRLFQRTTAQWSRLSEAEPHWSVLAQDAYRRERLVPDSEAQFYETGRGNAELLEIFEGRTRTRLSRGACLELGCGLGRITRFLADRFESVIGADVSAANLKLCRQRLDREGITNVELIHLRDLAQLADLPGFDVFFSVIVLQHNSPPVQKAMLEAILSKVQPGGGCLFQTLTNPVGYTFEAGSYLDSPVGEMEMHALPQYVVFDLLRRHGLLVREVAMDSWSGLYGSNTFFATR
jgi:2-polyprenyl-3-methyl-5-hydroxy-6-metoxy-1,4-benzoquinol methylase